MIKQSLKIAIYLPVAILAWPTAPATAQNDIMAADEQCRLELSVDNSVDWRGAYGRGYEVFGDLESFETVTISVRHQGAACQFFLTAAPISGSGVNTLNGPGNPLTYDLLKTTSGPSFLSSDFLGTQTSRVEGQFRSGSSVQAANLFVAIPANQLVRGGTYTGQAMVRLFRIEGGNPELVGEAPLAILAPVASVLKVRSNEFPQGVRESTIDLGDLTSAARRSVDFNVMSNAEILVSFQSANRGKLAHEAGAPGIAYDLLFKGQNIDLSAIGLPSRINHSSGSAEMQVPLEIVVPAPYGLPAAGRYNDALTITFTAE